MIPKARPLEEYLPADLQVKATMHFTPPALARQVARILAPRDGMNVLDVGAGAGMFCIAAAQAARWAHFVGVEWRTRLVEVATKIAGQLRVPNVEFVCSDALALDWSAYDAFYFYNPFAEHVMESPFVIDRTVPLEPTRYDHYIDGVCERLTAHQSSVAC